MTGNRTSPVNLCARRYGEFMFPPGHPDWERFGGGKLVCKVFGVSRCGIDDWSDASDAVPSLAKDLKLMEDDRIWRLTCSRMC